jgi:hypothetical protein
MVNLAGNEVTPRAFVDFELQLVNKMFNEQKEIYPLFVIVKGTERFLVPVVFKNEVHKEIVAQGIKDLVKKAEPDVVVYIAEAWVVIVRNKLDRMPIPNRDPNRIEVVTVIIEFKTGEKFGCEARIVREIGLPPRLENFKVHDNHLGMGRFCDFFPITQVN